MRRWAIFLVASLCGAGAAGAQTTFLVHLPSAPVEGASRVAEAVSALGDYLSEKVPGLVLEPQLFRRWSDADSFLDSNPENVTLTLTEASFLVDLGASAGLEPTHRLSREGSGSYHRLLVIKTGEDAAKLIDLRGRSIGVTEMAGSSDVSFLKSAVFEDEIDPASWFELRPVANDFLAIAEVLYGQADGALIAEHNPLLAAHLGKELKAVYTSPPLSQPVLAIRASAFTAEQRAALEDALRDLGSDPRGRKVFDELEVDGFESVRSASALLTLPSAGGKELEIALPDGVALELDLQPLPPASELPFTLAVELPEIPLPRASGGEE